MSVTDKSNNSAAFGQYALVQCQAFRCLAYQAPDGKWRSAFTNEELQHVIKVFSLEEEAGTPLQS